MRTRPYATLCSELLRKVCKLIIRGAAVACVLDYIVKQNSHFSPFSSSNENAAKFQVVSVSK